MHHLHILAGTFFAYPVTAWLTIDLRGNRLKDVFHMWPGLGITARHDGRAITRTFFTTRDTGTYIKNTFLCQCTGTAIGVGIQLVTTVDDDVALVQMRHNQINK